MKLLVWSIALLSTLSCRPSGDPNPKILSAVTEPKPAEAAPAAQAPKPADTLTVYCGRGEALAAPVLAAFEQASGIDLEIRYGDTAQLAAAILEEGARSPADVFIAQDASTLGFLEGKNAFAALPSVVIDAVPQGSKSARGLWVGLSGRARVLAYNTQRVKREELPKSLDELTAPKWRARVGWAPENASFQSFVAAMIEIEGREKSAQWLKAMKKNAPRDYAKNTPAVVAVSTGEIDVALVNHYYVHRLRDEMGKDLPVENHYFRSGDAASLVNLSGGAVLAASKKQAAAAKLLAYLVSADGQKHFVEGNHELPVANPASPLEGMPSIASLKAPAIDPADLDNLQDTVALLRETEVLR